MHLILEAECAAQYVSTQLGKKKVFCDLLSEAVPMATLACRTLDGTENGPSLPAWLHYDIITVAV